MKQSNSLRDLKKYREQQEQDNNENEEKQSVSEVTYKDLDVSNETSQSINTTTAYDVKNAQTLAEEKEDEESSSFVVDLPPPTPELKDPKIITFVGQLPKSVLRLAEKIELSQTKLELIANYSNKSILKDHRPIQEKLVKTIAPLAIEQAKVEISQAIRDLETGAIHKIEGQNSYVMDYDLREKIPKKHDRVKHPLDYFLQFQCKTFPEMMYLLTGHKLMKMKHVMNQIMLTILKNIDKK